MGTSKIIIQTNIVSMKYALKQRISCSWLHGRTLVWSPLFWILNGPVNDYSHFYKWLSLSMYGKYCFLYHMDSDLWYCSHLQSWVMPQGYVQISLRKRCPDFSKFFFSLYNFYFKVTHSSCYCLKRNYHLSPVAHTVSGAWKMKVLAFQIASDDTTGI